MLLYQKLYACQSNLCLSTGYDEVKKILYWNNKQLTDMADYHHLCSTLNRFF